MNLGQQLLAAAERHPGAEAVVDEQQRLTYSDLAERAATVAGGLSALGVKAGDRVAAALRNRVETVLLYWACQWLGACFVPLNWRLKSEEIRYCATDAEATVFVAEPHLVETTGARLYADLPSGDAAPGPFRADDRDPALMLYTSGTTGRPKGVPRSQRAEWSAALAHVIQCRYQPGERTLGVMPLYHTMAVRSLLAMHAVGGCFVVRSEFDATRAIDVIAAERVSALYLAPTLYHDLVESLASASASDGANDGDGDGRRTLPVPRLAYAGAPMSATLVQRCTVAFAPEVFVNHYGSTEI
ncbi:MAG TPA: AMP-binding protein, partial [Acidimicrobiia bacterium]|nr:AMP-binding protein [Acidimicrobiia bacterium]